MGNRQGALLCVLRTSMCGLGKSGRGRIGRVGTMGMGKTTTITGERLQPGVDECRAALVDQCEPSDDRSGLGCRVVHPILASNNSHAIVAPTRPAAAAQTNEPIRTKEDGDVLHQHHLRPAGLQSR